MPLITRWSTGAIRRPAECALVLLHPCGASNKGDRRDERQPETSDRRGLGVALIAMGLIVQTIANVVAL
jgi:hypothetical protein